MVNSSIINDKEYIGKIKVVSVPIVEVANSKAKRFEASVYSTEGRVARKKIEESNLPLASLKPNDGIISDCLYPNRFKRIYVDKKTGLDFFLPSQINEIYPTPDKYISPKTEVNIEELKVKKGSILLTRSGTIGNLTYVSDTLENRIFSDDVIRMYFDDPYNAGYVYAFLKSKAGQDILTTNNYGAVIQHVEPSHLGEIKVPIPPSDLKISINDLIVKSFRLRDTSNKLINEAKSLLIQNLQLPPIEELPQKTINDKKKVIAFMVPASQLKNRFDGSYHVPIAEAITLHISKYAQEVTSLSDERISDSILLPGRFKRVYVGEDNGIPFFGGKQIHELVPSGMKYLSKVHHTERFNKQLELKENMILVTCSGTIGKVAIVPKHWDGWAANQHILRIIPKDSNMAGYIFAWVDTDYGKSLIKRYTYGAVVDEIDDKQLSKVPIPLIQDNMFAKINELVLDANKKRYLAYQLEKEAISIIEDKILK